MNFAKAMRPEHALQSDGVEVGQVRRRETALPQTIERPVETEPAEETRESEKGALAAGQDEHEETSLRESLETGRGSLSWRRKMFEDIVKADDVELRPIGEVLRKEPGYDREPVAPRFYCDGWIRLETAGEIAATSGRLHEPAVRAADVQEAGGL